MDVFNTLKTELLEINQDIASLFPKAKTIAGIPEHSFAEGEKTCNAIYQQLSEEVVRAAVVGPIKSGKSTFVNSLFKGDYVKRGAGVITSIVTRIRSGKDLRARLYLKSWDEVNADIEQAYMLLPTFNRRSDDERFDLRRQKDRTALEFAIDSLSADQLFTNNSRNENSVLLSSYLNGFDHVSDLIATSNKTKIYEGTRFREHKAFVGDDSLAVYLRDLMLEISSTNMNGNIEIADCQGSDSTNPLHLTMIQEYLMVTHLIIYVISSRTGLRQADIKFLNMIKKMGIMDNIVFVVNCDFSEHESIDDLKSVIGKIKTDLAVIKPDPEIFAISALYNLFRSLQSDLSEKDQMRLSIWESDKEYIHYSNNETERFGAFFSNKLNRERYSLLLRNHLERLAVLLSGMAQWISVNQDMLERDSDDANEIISKIQEHQDRINQIKALIKSTLNGAAQKIREELRADVNRFFDLNSEHGMNRVLNFIRQYNVDLNGSQENLATGGFSPALHQMFQEFKKALDAFMAESINPDVFRFVRQTEKKIGEYFESIAAPYDVMARDALSEYNSTMETFGISSITHSTQKMEMPDIESVKSVIGLKLAAADSSMLFSSKIQTEAVMRLGFYRVAKVFKRLLKKNVKNKEDEIKALRDSMRRIKIETEKSIISHFKDYTENIKFQYLFKLVDALSNHLNELLIGRFQVYITNLTEITELISNKQIDKKQASSILNEMYAACYRIDTRIHSAREKIQLTV